MKVPLLEWKSVGVASEDGYDAVECVGKTERGLNSGLLALALPRPTRSLAGCVPAVSVRTACRACTRRGRVPQGASRPHYLNQKEAGNVGEKTMW
ncbi:unnamed protein product [Prunus armeniaca]|uniref:Uncharacterized protein n=1 Tax=Prunus armeniaca TaxID=36596 RepID=A0A6J5VPR4_PRUAR|nr:unnamed protein product [Prunus armeniaca]